MSLAGHSDADVGLHALTDAVLGAIGAGDIGMHFPTSDPRWRGAASGQFLRHAADLVRHQGGVIAAVDVTIICERPKIAPHRAVMVERIAGILGIAPGRVSVKATTTEKLGFTGRAEGIAAQAVATVRLPLGFSVRSRPGVRSASRRRRHLVGVGLLPVMPGTRPRSPPPRLGIRGSGAAGLPLPPRSSSPQVAGPLRRSQGRAQTRILTQSS
jgi:2-C-methyl-D-erythritol 2,4-cyclodiphosphate synthase